MSDDARSKDAIAIRDSIDAKLRRAFRHIDELEAASRTFAAAEPVRIALDPPDVDGFRLARLVIVAEPPIELGVIAGEIAHQLRSSLDHLMTELVHLDHPEVDDTPPFPIYTKRANFEQHVKALGLRQLLRPSDLDRVRAAQPYVHLEADRHHQRGGFVNAIRLFDNADKHQVVHAALAKPISWDDRPAVLSIAPDQRHPSVEALDWHVGELQPSMYYETGRPYVKIRIRPGHAPPRFRLTPPPGVGFIHDERHWDVRLFRHFGQRVEDLIASFHGTGPTSSIESGD